MNIPMTLIGNKRILLIKSILILLTTLVSVQAEEIVSDTKHLLQAERINILSANSEAIEVNFLKGTSTESFEIWTDSGTPNYQVLNLKGPNRLVIDLKGTKITSPRTVPIADSKYVTALRLGKHQDKSRVVLDLAPSVSIKTEVHDENNKIIVKLTTTEGQNIPAVQNIADTAQGQRKDIAALPVMDNSNDKAKARLPDSIDGELNNADTSLGQDVAPIKEVNIEINQEKLDETTKTANGKAVISSLELDDTANAEAIKATVSAPTRIEMKKTAPSEYILRLKGTALSDDSIQTIIANNPSSGIRSVRPVQEGADTLLRIFARPAVTLEANLEGDSLVIAQPVLARDFERKAARAQAKEDVVKAKEPAPVLADSSKKEESVNNQIKVSDTPQKPVSGIETLSRTDNDGSEQKYTGRLISLDLQDTDIDNALRIIAEVSNLNIIASDEVTGKVTLRLIDVPWDQALDVILKTNALDKVVEGNVVRIAPIEKLRIEREALKQAKQAQVDLEEPEVEYLRVNYAKASEMKPLIDQVITERGEVTFDERTNQVIIKDIPSGLTAARRLVSKLDMRTPQVLLETQIVEANRSLLRDLGSQFGFKYVQSPETGNATGSNFPNAIGIGASLANPAASATNAIDLLFTSADGTKSLSDKLTAYESEGRVRIVSRPSVATTNNQQATIKSVQKFRIRLPNGGVSVATGQGASAQGQGASATETIEVGIILEVTPQASPDYYVLLDINAKSSTLGPIVGSDQIPSEIERSATSSVLVSSGQTFGLGGIYKMTDNSSIGGLPFFKDIPFIGHLFRRTNVDNSEEELLFFLTPRIVEGSFDDAAMRATN